MRAQALSLLSLLSASACADLVELGEPRGYRADAGVDGGADAGHDADAGEPDDRLHCADGPLRWVKRFGDAATQRPSAATPDGEGGAFLAGIFSGQLDLGDGPLASAGQYDIFLARFDAEGRHLWSRRLGDTEHQDGVLQLVRAPDGDVVLSGELKGSVDFGDGIELASKGWSDGFVARYSALGEFEWARTFGGTNVDFVTGVQIDAASGDLLVAGTFREQIEDPSGGTSTSAGENDVLLSRWSAAGDHLWTQTFGGADNDSVNHIAVGVDGKIVIGGATDGDVDFGTGVLDNTDENDAWLAVYEADGSPAWSEIWTGPGAQDLRRIAIDPGTGNIFLLGVLGGSTSFGGQTISAGYGGFLARLDASGSHVASRALENFWAPHALVVADGSVNIAGLFWGTTDFGGGRVTADEIDGALVRLEPGLGHVWTLQVSSDENDEVTALAIDGLSTSFAAGFFQRDAALPGCGAVSSAGDTDILLMKLRP